MYSRVKRTFGNIIRIFSLAIFILIVFTNVKITIMDNRELSEGNLSLFGLEINSFVPTYADYACNTCTRDQLCWDCNTGNGALVNFCCQWTCGGYGGYLCGKCYDSCSGWCCGGGTN